jgi:NAD(P)-dependent dehydrogenase (short-subunit alcohol dehydrogenase family)
MVNRLENKVAIVTGGASGLGRLVVESMVAEGAAVVVFDRDEAAGQTLVSNLAEKGYRVAFLRGDVTEPNDFTSAIALAENTFGGFDVIHNNAGVQLEKPIHDTTDSEFDWVMGVNLRGVFYGCRAAINAFHRQGRGGSIINTASIAAHAGDNFVGAYTASKTAVLGLTRAIAVGYATDGIRANSVSPGDMETPMIEKYFAATEDPAAARREMEAEYPGKRLAHPREVAQAVVFLASDEASFVSGEDIRVDGGLLAQIY